jgi:predicted acyl esterase
MTDSALRVGDYGHVRFSTETPWEASDPAYWVTHGYVVIHGDSRGYCASDGDGQGAILGGGHEKEDYYDLIEWAAAQEWSTGKVGLLGVSYLAISQWFVASTCPPSLAAICPWEGFSDMYRHATFVGGVNPTNFFNMWINVTSSTAKGGGAEDLLGSYQAIQTNNNLIDDLFKSKSAAVEQINAPALVCGSWSDQGIHNPGTFDAYERLTCPKWLYTHGRSKWNVFYSESDFQRQFFDFFLKV